MQNLVLSLAVVAALSACHDSGLPNAPIAIATTIDSTSSTSGGRPKAPASPDSTRTRPDSVVATPPADSIVTVPRPAPAAPRPDSGVTTTPRTNPTPPPTDSTGRTAPAGSGFTGQIIGRLPGARSASPIKDVTVILLKLPQVGPPIEFTRVRTDTAGVFRAINLADGPYVVRAEPPAGAPFRATEIHTITIQNGSRLGGSLTIYLDTP